MQFVSTMNTSCFPLKYVTKHEPDNEDRYRNSQQPSDSIAHLSHLQFLTVTFTCVTKTRSNQLAESAARESNGLCAAFIAMYHGAATWTRAALATWPGCASRADWIPNNTPTINPARMIRRILSDCADQPVCGNDHHNASHRNRRVSTYQLLRPWGSDLWLV